MKIEIDLLNAHDHPDVGRAALVALMNVLPDDEVRLAMQQWAACRDAVEVADQAVAIPFDVGAAQPQEPQAQPQEPQAQPQEPQAQPQEAQPQEPQAQPQEQSTASYDKFTYGGRAFSARKTGPAAALRQAMEDLGGCGSAVQLASIRRQFEQLDGVLREVGHPDKAGQLMMAVEDLEAKLAAAERGDEDTSSPQADLLAEPAKQNGADAGLEAMTLRELCRHAEQEVGRERLLEVLAKHGVTKLAGVAPTLEAKVRADVAEMLP